jgi:putative membrane protein
MAEVEHADLELEEIAAVQHGTHGGHPSVKEYIRIGLILGVFTGLEVAAKYANLSSATLIVTLLGLAIVKFTLVVMYFMHLKFDDRRYARFFVMGLALAVTLFFVVLISFKVFLRQRMALPPWHAHLDVWLLFGSIISAYLIACRRHAEATGESTSTRRKRLFIAGVLVLWVASDWPIHDLGDQYLSSMHMVEHMLLSLIAPPLLIAGVPAWMLRRFLRPEPVAGFFRVMTRPVVALLVFNGVLLFIHWPVIVTDSLRSELVHFWLHFVFVFSALAMWWPVMSTLPEYPALTPPGQMMYLFFQSLAPTIPASFLTFGYTLLYPIYATFPRIWGIGPVRDQMISGLTMKLVGGLILWGFIATIFFRWYAKEQREETPAWRHRAEATIPGEAG